MAKVKLLINNIDRTSILLEPDLTVELNIGHAIDTFEFTLWDADRSVNSAIYEGLDVLLEKSTDALVRYFGGIIVEKSTEIVGLGLMYHITCQDWRVLADKTTITKQYVSTSDLAIIQDVFTTAKLTEIVTNSANFTASGRTFDFMEFLGTPLSAVLDQITAATGYVWYIDVFKNLHYHPFYHHRSSSFWQFSNDYDLLTAALDASETGVSVGNGSNFIANDIIQVDSEQMRVVSKSGNTLTVTRGYNGTTAATHEISIPVFNTKTSGAPFFNVKYDRRIGEFNAVEIRGYDRLSSDTTQTYKSNGTQKSFSFLRDPVAAIADTTYQPITREPSTATDSLIDVEVNTGTDGTPTWTDQKVTVRRADKTTQFTDDANLKVIWDPLFLMIEFATAPPNFATNSFRIKGRYQSPSIGFMEDKAAIQRSNGRKFQHTMTEITIRSEDQALDIAKAFLREQGPREHLVIEFEQDGLEVCQSVLVTSTPLGLTRRPFLVTQLTIRILGGSKFMYTAVLEHSWVLDLVK